MTIIKHFYRTAFFLGVFILVCNESSIAQYHYQNEPILQVIEDIRQQTSFRFLYRDALIADTNLNFSSNKDHLWANLRTALNAHNLNLKVNEKRRQAIIFQQQNRSRLVKKMTIRGQVVDNSTGERLPYATILWHQDGKAEGLSSNESGAFVINRTFRQQSIDVRCSYIGYAPKTLTLDVTASSNIRELTFRLQPKRIDGNELLVIGRNSFSNINKQSAKLVDIGAFSPMGESNTLRALQALPSVSLSPALSDGLNVRGSPADGFRVLLDDITIFNQSHLFGLIDSFNADVLQRSSFFYDIAPAQYQAPPGGTLSLLTKTGSLQRIAGTGGLSNSSVRFSLEGPLKKGKSSWLIAGRKSYMNTINWFKNAKLTRWGLNVNRRQGGLGEDLIDFQSHLIRPGKASASFFDLHGKAYFEQENGDRFIVSGYFGGDDTRENAERLFRSFSTSGGSGFSFRPVISKNDWQNGAATARYQHWFGDDVYATSTVGTSIYKTSFLKDDFTYVDIDRLDQSLRAFVFPLKNKSVLNEFKAKQQFEIYAKPWTWTAGFSYKYYIGEYLEQSFDRPGYFSSKRTNKIDAFAQADYTGSDILNVFAGTRVHYYSSGHFLRWSPRIKLKLFPHSNVSLAGGFSRNHQFINQISLSNTVTSDVWILAGRDQPPTSVNYYSSGAYFDIAPFLYAQAEGYIKQFENVRLHELNTFSLSNTYNKNPWYINNTGAGKGLEFLVRATSAPVSLTQTFTISKITLSNPIINNGESFYADWDRRYRYTAMVEAHPVHHFSLYLSWMFATGTTNRLATFGPQNENRLDNYRRTDVSVEYEHTFQATHLTLSASVFNVLDRQNPWYRDLSVAIDQSSTPNQFRGAPVDVYDIGLQPSFNVGITF